MKKKTLVFREYENVNGSYGITISNVGVYADYFCNLKQIVRHFSIGSELFFGHYKTDGFNISRKKFLQYSTEIPLYFETYGEYCELTKGWLKTTCFGEGLTVCRISNNDNIYQIIDHIFHYYLETIVFCPLIDWGTFVASYENYMNLRVDEYVMNGYTNFLFSYVDSGDFSIFFNPTLYNPVKVREESMRILNTGI